MLAVTGLAIFVFFLIEKLRGTHTFTDYQQVFCSGAAAGLIGAAVSDFKRILRLIKNPTEQKKAEIEDSDERNRFIELKSAHISSRVFFYLLYAALFASVFFDKTVHNVLLSVFVVYGAIRIVSFFVCKKRY